MYICFVDINIYTRNNGVGLEADAKILKACLPTYTVNIIDWMQAKRQKADVGIHMEHIRRELLHLAPYNIAVPNPEWFDAAFMPLLKRIDAVWCKTKVTKAIFTPLHRKCIYTGFTSIDKYKEGVERHMMFLHLAGKSSHKGSATVLSLWKSDKTLPLLYMQKLENYGGYHLTQPNYIGQFSRVKDISEIMNTAMFHLCCSKAEGFGHYNNEALSAGAVVITTDAAPLLSVVLPVITAVPPPDLTRFPAVLVKVGMVNTPVELATSTVPLEAPITTGRFNEFAPVPV